MTARNVARAIQLVTIVAGGVYLPFAQNREVRLFLLGCLSVDAIVLGSQFFSPGRFSSLPERTHRLIVLFVFFLAVLVAGAVAADRKAFVEPIRDY